MARNSFYKFVILLAVASLVACGSPAARSATASTGPPTVISDPTHALITTSTITLTPSSSPSVTPSFTPLPDLPTPELTHGILDDLLFQRVSSDCQLPCWRGLRVGISDPTDIQQMFDRVFGFHGFLYPVPDFVGSPPQGYRLVGHYWDLNEPGGYFSLLVWENADTRKLVSLNFIFRTQYSEYHPDIRPARVIQELGEPTYWLVSSPEPGGQGTIISISFLMIYKNGVSFYYPVELPVKSSSLQNGIEISRSEYCLDQFTDGNATIGEPFIGGLDKLTPMQTLNIGIAKDLASFQDILGISVAEIMGRAPTEEHICLPITARNP